MATIRKVLVANRGEIARRIFRTCRSLGIETVAVFSDADADLPFVREADVAVRIGPATAAKSYLNGERILEAARRTGADAIHPGFGFLAENAEFAQACADAGVVFIGPKPLSMRAMGLKRESKDTVSAAGVPVVPGYAGDDQSTATLVSAGSAVGFPVIVKASAGGGGRGMRIVRGPDGMADVIESAKRESLAAFGDETLIIERYIERPRHIEVQVLGDTHGNVVHLFERECSIQRRHQKIIEESPSMALDDALRERMGAAAVEAAQAIGYQNAGTVEFIVDPDGEFFFLEMNTRLQVEHPVTEMVTGLDLVALQIAVAEGQPLPFTQSELRMTGASIECRLYAEDPAHDFLPVTGTLHAWDRDDDAEGMRLDAGVEAGDVVSVHYDPMIAKVISHGATREIARRRMVRALRRMSLAGITTNRAYLVNVLEHEAFVAGRLNTHFVEEHADALRVTLTDESIALAAAAAALHGQGGRARQRTLLPALRTVRVDYVDQGAGVFSMVVAVSVGADSVDAPETAFQARVLEHGAKHVVLETSDIVRRFGVHSFANNCVVHSLDAQVDFTVAPRFPAVEAQAVSGGCLAPMPGKVIRVAVAVGDAVHAGQTLMVLEAMKMEHAITATLDGQVAEVRVVEGDQVEADTVLAVVAPNESAARSATCQSRRLPERMATRSPAPTPNSARPAAAASTRAR